MQLGGGRVLFQVGTESKMSQGEGRWKLMGECNKVQAILLSTGRKEDEGEEDKGMVVIGES